MAKTRMTKAKQKKNVTPQTLKLRAIRKAAHAKMKRHAQTRKRNGWDGDHQFRN